MMTSPFADAETKKARRDICIQCEHVRGVRVPYCSVCRCPIMSKTSLAATACPLAAPKWQATGTTPVAADLDVVAVHRTKAP